MSFKDQLQDAIKRLGVQIDTIHQEIDENESAVGRLNAQTDSLYEEVDVLIKEQKKYSQYLKENL